MATEGRDMKEQRKIGRLLVRKNAKHGWLEYDLVVVWPNGEWERERKRSPRPTESATREWARVRENEIYRLGPPSQRQTTTFKDFMPTFRRMHYPHGRRGPLKPSQIASIESAWKIHIEPAFGELEIAKVTKAHLAKFSAGLFEPHQLGKNAEHKRSAKTVNNILAVLNKMLARAEEWDVVRERLPRAKLFSVAKPEIEFYDFDELERLIAAARALSPRHELVVLLGARAGLRAGEMIALQPDDIDHKRGHLHVRRSSTRGKEGAPKSGRGRRVPMPDDLAEALRKSRGIGRARVLLREDDKTPCSIESLRLLVGASERRAGVAGDGRKGQLHKLRHSYASHLIMRGVDIKTVSELLGHGSLGPTMRYLHLVPSALDVAVAKLNEPPPRFATPDRIAQSLPGEP
jgi:integrase